MAEQFPDALAHEPRMRILVVDGDTEERGRTGEALGEYYTVHFASGASEALSALRADQPDFIVSEIDLPEGDGLVLCKQVRALPEGEHLPILLLTRRASIHDKVAGFQAGADDYVVKPVDVRHFYARVRLLCRIKGLEKPRRLGV